ncbi:hypothetical protein AY599_22745 [Leptolyngbya valderiana BDU 20041]|nr:hypothetical protein AY599_22745 [Leptolyngbya valderiana BDU 20041]
MKHLPGSYTVGRAVEQMLHVGPDWLGDGPDLDDHDAANVGQIVIVLAVIAALVALGLWLGGVF